MTQISRKIRKREKVHELNTKNKNSVKTQNIQIYLFLTQSYKK